MLVIGQRFTVTDFHSLIACFI